ncbi:hypothetical protein HDU76_007982 [Blyttiomyces sp. JEL0837]|nr:hypothetical protein HDU76_007982 [Blyttiomyces sp. JEL0837]
MPLESQPIITRDDAMTASTVAGMASIQEINNLPNSSDVPQTQAKIVSASSNSNLSNYNNVANSSYSSLQQSNTRLSTQKITNPSEIPVTVLDSMEKTFTKLCRIVEKEVQISLNQLAKSGGSTTNISTSQSKKSLFNLSSWVGKGNGQNQNNQVSTPVSNGFNSGASVGSLNTNSEGQPGHFRRFSHDVKPRSATISGGRTSPHGSTSANILPQPTATSPLSTSTPPTSTSRPRGVGRSASMSRIRSDSPSLIDHRHVRRLSKARVKHAGKNAVCHFQREGAYNLRFTIEARVRADVDSAGGNGNIGGGMSTILASSPNIAAPPSFTKNDTFGYGSIGKMSRSETAMNRAGFNCGNTGHGDTFSPSSSAGSMPSDSGVSGSVVSGSVNVLTTASTADLEYASNATGTAAINGNTKDNNIESQAKEIRDAITTMFQTLTYRPLVGTYITLVFSAILEHDNPNGDDYELESMFQTQLRFADGKEIMEAKQVELEAAYKAQGVSLATTTKADGSNGFFAKMFGSVAKWGAAGGTPEVGSF